MDGLMEALALELLSELPPHRRSFWDWGLGLSWVLVIRDVIQATIIGMYRL